MLNRCVDERDFVLSLDSKALKQGQFEYKWASLLSSDVDSAVLSVSHTSVTSAFQDHPLLSNSC